MTISSQTRKAGPFVGNGTVATFPFTFKVFQASDLQLVKLNSTTNVETQLVLTTDYTVSLNANQNTNPGGTITLTAGVLPTGYKLTITTNIAPLQAVDLTNSGGFYPSVINAALDKLTILVQQIIERAGRTLTLPLSTPTDVSASLPAPQANAFIGWDRTGKALQNYDNQALATVVAYGTAKGDIFTGDGSTTQFNLTSNPGALNNLDVSVGGVTQLPNSDYTWDGGTLVTFVNAPPAGVSVFVRYMQGLPFGIVQGSDVVGGVLWSDVPALDLDTSGLVDNTVVYCADRGVVGDGGGGNLRFMAGSTIAADGVKVYSVTGGRLVRDGFHDLNDRWGGTVGDGAADDTAAIKRTVAVLPQRGKLSFDQATARKITDTIAITGKAGSVIDLGNQTINAASFSTPKSALVLKGNSESVIKDVSVVGSVTNTTEGILLSADASNITIHANITKLRAANCQVGVQVGVDTYQMSDSNIGDIYASDCVTGVKLTGENTLAMNYGRIAAYNNTTIGVHLEQGGGSIASLQTAASGADLYIGSTSGANHGKLARWDILSGYSEEGVSGERFIDSAACTDANPFKEQIAISGFRVTPFTSTNQPELIRWRLNGDLIISRSSINHGQQEPIITLDHNTAYRAPRVLLNDCTIQCAPTGSPQVPLSYKLTDSRQYVEINARVDNGLTWWQNNGSANEGTMKSGIYMSKIAKFEQSLLSIAGLKGAWSLRDMTSGQCKNLVLGKPNLAASATLQRRDMWLDDGLVGFFKNATTSKTLSTTSSEYSAAEYTFGCILRTATVGTDETDYTALGGAGGINLAIGDTSGGFVRCMVGAYNCQGTPTNPLDPHLVIGRYVPGASVKMDAINLRTGEIIRATVGSGPALVDLTWVNGVSIRNDNTVRGFPFVYSRALSDNEVTTLLQSALQLTDSWRN